MQIRFLGSIGSVSGSRLEVTYKGKVGFIDCGLFQGPKELRQRNWLPVENAAQAQWILLTHAHIDHSGYLPKFHKDGFRGKIYCSEATQVLSEIMLLDAAHLQEEDARFANTTGHSHHKPALPLYDTRDAQAVLRHFESKPLEQWIPLNDGLQFRLFRAGHILGSTFIQLSYPDHEGRKIITFSGDVGRYGSLMLKDPVTLPETNYLVVESTYGDRAVTKSNIEVDLAGIVTKVLGRGGTLLIPAFAVGRTQDILYLLTKLTAEKKIKKPRVVIDSPMATRVTEVYRHYSKWLKTAFNPTVLEALENSDFEYTSDADSSMLLCMDTSPKIVIAGSGMLQGGRILHHLSAKLADEKNGVLFVGYQGDGTKGRVLKNGISQIRIHHKPIDVNAEIFSIDSLSAHADSDELMRWIKSCPVRPRQIFLNHGEMSALGALQYRIENELGWHCMVPAEGAYLNLD